MAPVPYENKWVAAMARRPLRAPFPSDVYEVDLEMPVRDDTSIGKQILHVADLGKGSGLGFVQFKVAAESRSTTTMPPASPGPGRGSSNS